MDLKTVNLQLYHRRRRMISRSIAARRNASILSSSRSTARI